MLLWLPNNQICVSVTVLILLNSTSPLRIVSVKSTFCSTATKEAYKTILRKEEPSAKKMQSSSLNK